jgi:hypothetical protein
MLAALLRMAPFELPLDIFHGELSRPIGCFARLMADQMPAERAELEREAHLPDARSGLVLQHHARLRIWMVLEPLLQSGQVMFDAALCLLRERRAVRLDR